MRSIWDLANPQLRDLAVYQPGKPISETARELGCRPDEIIKLASNENPLGPSPRAVEAMGDAIRTAHLYPDGAAYELGGAVAEKLGVGRDEIILGNGSNEVIEFLGHAFLSADDEIVTPQHSFSAYKIIAKVFGAHTIEAPLENFTASVDALLDAITSRTEIIFIANPNNPTGTMIAQRDVDEFMSRVPDNLIVCFDEAYYEYIADPPDTLKFVRDGRNVIVLRTFSKIHGLASLRAGYGIARPELIAALQKTREPFNVNGIAQAGARAALDDFEHQRKTKQLTDEGRNYLQEQFAEMHLRFIPSQGNFVLVNVGNGEARFREMLQRRVIVRAMRGYDLAEWIRISIGTMEENGRCIDALKEVIASRR